MRLLLCIFFAFVVQCSFAQLQFSEVAASKGISVSYGPSNASVFGAGISFVDFDGDGWDDITIASYENEQLYFMKNTNGTFARIFPSGITSQTKAKQVLWVDYDNDGDKDFFVTSVEGQNHLYNNNGNNFFTDVTASSGLFQEDLTTYGATFGDIDNDGDLDLFICNREDNAHVARNYLYRNDNGSFVDVTAFNGISTVSALSFVASFFDYDNDGDQDLYISNDKLDPNVLYQNDGTGMFTDVSTATGAGINIDAMSTTIGDYNNDGFFDVYVANTQSGNYLLQNNGGTSFTNVAATAGVEMNSFAWGAVFLDADLDENLDLYVSSSMDGSVPTFLSSAFFHNNGDDTFTIPNNIGFHNDEAMSFGNAIGDFNNDGKPDIVVLNVLSNVYLFENQTTTSNAWLKVDLEGVISNKDGVGNKIEVRANGKSQYRYTVSGEGYLGQNSEYEFFGLGPATNIEYIKVTWNATGQVETINNVQPNQAIKIQEGNGILSSTGQELDNFSVYPNPSDSGLFTVSADHVEAYDAEVYDVSGRMVLTKQRMSDTIDLSSLSKGVYFARVYADGGSRIFKLIYQ
jgi:uncharacterized protein YxeA